MTSFRDFALTVLDRREAEGVRGIVSERSRFELHIWRAGFARMSLPEIRTIHLREWIAAMQMKKARDTRGDRLLSTHTIARAKALVSAILGRAVEDELLETNPCRDIKLRKRAEELVANDPWTFLTLDEQRAFADCEAIQPEHRIAIRFACSTGLRQGEQCNLELRDVHVEGSSPFVFVRYGSKGKPPKNGKTRKVPLFGDGLAATRVALSFVSGTTNPHGLLFPSPTGERRGVGKPLGREQDEHDVWVDAWKLAKRRVGITRRLRWHDLRHTCASNLVSGVLGRRWTLEEVRPLMGHSSIMITQRYSHLGEDVLAACARETNGGLGGHS